MVKAAVLGYGTVGSGIVEVIKTNQKLIDERAGEQIDIKYILELLQPLLIMHIKKKKEDNKKLRIVAFVLLWV